MRTDPETGIVYAADGTVVHDPLGIIPLGYRPVKIRPVPTAAAIRASVERS